MRTALKTPVILLSLAILVAHLVHIQSFIHIFSTINVFLFALFLSPLLLLALGLYFRSSILPLLGTLLYILPTNLYLLGTPSFKYLFISPILFLGVTIFLVIEKQRNPQIAA